ncbi:MAG: universal stress protein [Gemmataceae bacterium]|nr:universal stress protein [Gemmataceae bacterium]
MNLRRILAPVDFSPRSEEALRYAVAIAEKFATPIHLLHVFQDVGVYQTEVVTIPQDMPPIEQLLQPIRTELNALAAKYKLDRFGGPVDTMIGSPVEAIVDYAREHHIDLITVGTHGRGWLAHALLGSVAEKVVRLAPCAVLTVRSPM